MIYLVKVYTFDGWISKVHLFSDKMKAHSWGEKIIEEPDLNAVKYEVEEWVL
jgi:hypothetical protein